MRSLLSPRTLRPRDLSSRCKSISFILWKSTAVDGGGIVFAQRSGASVDVCPSSDKPRNEKSDGAAPSAGAPPRIPRSADRYTRSFAERGDKGIANDVSGTGSFRKGMRLHPTCLCFVQVVEHKTAWLVPPAFGEGSTHGCIAIVSSSMS